MLQKKTGLLPNPIPHWGLLTTNQFQTCGTFRPYQKSTLEQKKIRLFHLYKNPLQKANGLTTTKKVPEFYMLTFSVPQAVLLRHRPYLTCLPFCIRQMQNLSVQNAITTQTPKMEFKKPGKKLMPPEEYTQRTNGLQNFFSAMNIQLVEETVKIPLLPMRLFLPFQIIHSHLPSWKFWQPYLHKVNKKSEC